MWFKFGCCFFFLSNFYFTCFIKYPVQFTTLVEKLVGFQSLSVVNLTTCMYFALINLQTAILCKPMGVSTLWSEAQSLIWL